MSPTGMPAQLRWDPTRTVEVRMDWRMPLEMRGSSQAISGWMIGAGRNTTDMHQKVPSEMHASRGRDYELRFVAALSTLISARIREENGLRSRLKFVEKVRDSGVLRMDDSNCLHTQPEEVKESRNEGRSVSL